MFRSILVLCVLAAGCSLVGLGGTEGYMDARVAPPLEVPAGLDDSSISDLMVVPSTSSLGRLSGEQEVPRPGQLIARGATDPVKVQKLGERRWLVITEAPRSVWPKVIQFLADNGVAPVEEVPTEGYIRSGEFTISRGRRYRDAVRQIVADSDRSARRVELRLRIEQGNRDGHSEIHIRYLDASDAPLFGWPEKSRNIDVEDALLMELGAYLKGDLDRVAVSMLAQEISTKPKAWLAKDGTSPSVLRLRMDYNRAWAMVVSAFANAEVNVTDSDRDNAVMLVDMERDLIEGESGFFNWFSGSEELEIRLKPWREGYDVAVFQGEVPAPDELGQRVLLLIREYAT